MYYIKELPTLGSSLCSPHDTILNKLYTEAPLNQDYVPYHWNTETSNMKI